MKTLKSLFFALATILVASFGASAQNSKFGHVDFAELYSMMPGQDSVQIKYNAYKNTLQTRLNRMQAAYEEKLNEYNSAKLLSEDALILASLEEELTSMQDRIVSFQQEAQQGLLAKEEELTMPIIEAARNAVEEVAKANGYTYVFNSAEGLLLYASDSDNIMPLVKKHLGIE